MAGIVSCASAHFNLTISPGANCQASLPNLTGTNYFIAVDGCSSVTVTQSPAPGTLLSSGVYPVVLTAVDASGNAVRSTNTVVVTDTNAPVVTLLGSNPITIECHCVFTDPGATALDDCARTVSVTTNGTVLANTPGSYTINCQASLPEVTGSNYILALDVCPTGHCEWAPSAT